MQSNIITSIYEIRNNLNNLKNDSVHQHSIGHGIGLELNEPPVMTAGSNVALKDGTAPALELHLMESEGLAIKLEDTILVTGKGAEILTESPRKLNSREGYDEK